MDPLAAFFEAVCHTASLSHSPDIAKFLAGVLQQRAILLFEFFDCASVKLHISRAAPPFQLLPSHLCRERCVHLQVKCFFCNLTQRYERFLQRCKMKELANLYPIYEFHIRGLGKT